VTRRPDPQSETVWRNAAVMTVGTALSRITGVVRVAALAFALGVTGTRLADTYNLANTMPNIVYELFLGGILTSVFIPVLISVRKTGDGDPSALISTSLLALAALSVVAALAAPLVMQIYTFRIADPATRAAQLELSSFLLRWFAPQILFYGMSAIAQALYNTRGRFALPFFAPVLNNLVVIATLLTYARVVGTQGLDLDTSAKVLLGAGTTAGVAVQALVLVGAFRGQGLRFRPSLSDPAIKRTLRLAAYVIGYVVINQVGLWVVLALANGVQGGVTAWQIAMMFFVLPHGLFAVSIHTALLPELSRASADGDWDTYRTGFSNGIRSVSFLLLPAAVGYVILAFPITRLFLARGVADAADAAAVAEVLQLLAVGLVFFSAFQVLTRCFHALPDTKTPTLLNGVAQIVHIGAAVPLFAWLSVRGLAVAHAIAYAVGTALLVSVLHRRIPGGLSLRALTAPLARIGGVTAVMGLGVWAIAGATGGGDLVVVSVAVGAGAIIYFALSQVLGVEERGMLMALVRRRAQGGT
jgi:putative peptidoglycan lipid II flippase